jgi:sulfate permease, SulP family
VTIVVTTLAVIHLNLTTVHHVSIVGEIPAGLPSLHIDFINFEKWKILAPSASFIALIAYVESVAIAKVVANLRGERINPNQELIALGFSNFATAISGGMPVAGGFSRTMVNFSAGARTQIAMVIAALILSFAVVILVAVVPLIKIKNIYHTWHYDKGDGIAELMTFLGVLTLGIEEGITLGIFLTFISHLRKTSKPHIAVVGRIPNTRHYRNINRHKVETWEHLLLMRIDESITFANINYIEEFIAQELKKSSKIKHLVLIFSSVSDIDMTALETLGQLSSQLKKESITLNIAEAKGFMLDKLQNSDFFNQLNGQLFFDTETAIQTLTKNTSYQEISS